MLPRHSQLSEADLRRVFEKALSSAEGFLYSPKLFEKLERHGVSIQDLLHVCRHWELIRSTRWQYGEWRYRVEGANLDGKWMAAVVSVKGPTSILVITGFRFARGKKS
ncbi:MAG: hypothetical protein ACREIJ_01975 [Nitrospiraceae bacterium]